MATEERILPNAIPGELFESERYTHAECGPVVVLRRRWYKHDGRPSHCTFEATVGAEEAERRVKREKKRRKSG